MTDQPEKKAREFWIIEEGEEHSGENEMFFYYEDGADTMIDQLKLSGISARKVRVREVLPTDSDSVSVPREKNVQILIDALENAKTDLRDLDTVCMADYKLVISGFSRAVLSIQIALSDFRKAQALSRGGE